MEERPQRMGDDGNGREREQGIEPCLVANDGEECREREEHQRAPHRL